MKCGKTLIILGILVALVPFSGLPLSWRNIISVLLGASVIIIVLFFTKKEKIGTNKRQEHSFKELTDDTEPGEDIDNAIIDDEIKT